MVCHPVAARWPRWWSFLLCIAVGATLSATDVATQNKGITATFVAAVRPDSLMVPIAVFDGSEWWNPWPISYEADESIRRLAVPRTLHEIPAEWLPPRTVFPERWRLQLGSGRLVEIRALAPARPAGFSIKEFIGVRTDHPPQPAAPGDEIGLAIAGPGELGRFARPPADESRAILGPLMPRLRDLAPDALAKWRVEQPSEKTVELSPVGQNAELEMTLVRAINTFHGRTYYNLDGETRYRIRSSDPAACEVKVIVSGIVVADRRRIVSDTLTAAAVGHDCASGFEVVDYLATVQVQERFVWIIRVAVEDGFDYTLRDPLANNEIPLRGSWGHR